MKTWYNAWPPEVLYYPFDWLLPIKRGNPFTGYPIHGEESYHPFFIVGAPRSGNTLLRRILYAHPHLHIPPEMHGFGPTIRLFRQYRNMNWRDLVYFILAQYEFQPGFETLEISLRPLVARLLNIPESSRNLAFILNSLYRYHAEEKGKNTECKRWGDKTPPNVHFLNTIFSVFPDAQFIYMVRDGVDAIVSTWEAGIHKDLESSSVRWLTAVRAGDKFIRHHPDICLEIRYENLTQKPLETTVAVCDFLGVEYDLSLIDAMISSHEMAQQIADVRIIPHFSNVGQPISVHSIGKGRRKLSMAEKLCLQKLIGRELERLGYEPATH